LLKAIFVILILVIFYCVYINSNILQEGYHSQPVKCSSIKNCRDCGTKVTSDDGVCYWCNGKCDSGANYSTYASGSCSRDVNRSNCSATDSTTDTTTDTTTTIYPGYPVLVNIPPGTKMSQQHTPL
jgi:hypothetical protein